ncbi:MAG: LacI family DNA-binding transcriptional regulator [Streptosporangiaceae bacterium]
MSDPDDNVSPRGRPTMKDVAREAGVSLKTVSRVVNREPGVGEETASRVLTAVSRLGFRRNDVARTLRQGLSTASVGLVIENISDPFYSAITHAVEAVARVRGYLVLVGSSEEDPERERELVEDFCSRRVDGLLIVPTARDHRYIVPEIQMGTAAVFLDRPPRGLDADTVLSDNPSGVRSAVAHLAAHGHRRIGWIGVAETVWTGGVRFAAYRQALAAHELVYDPAVVRIGLHTVSEAADACAKLLSQPSPPTAIVTSNNRMSVGVVRACGSRPVDRRPAIVGFDDFELADAVQPPVTVIAQDPPALGRHAAELLFARLSGDDRPTQHVTLETRLVVRGSGEMSP